MSGPCWYIAVLPVSSSAHEKSIYSARSHAANSLMRIEHFDIEAGVRPTVGSIPLCASFPAVASQVSCT